MTYHGRPSRGCENCRKLHVKCDEKRPQCSRCLKMRKACGYRDRSELLFRDETASTQLRALQSYASSTASSRNMAGEHCMENFRQKLQLLHCPGRSLPTSLEDFAISRFYYATMENLPHDDRARGIHAQLPALYADSGLNSALRMATQAISYAVSSKSGYKTAQLSRKRYIRAIRAVELAIRDPVEVNSDRVLYAVLLLCGYETIMCDSKTPPAWGAHVDGAAALIKIQGKKGFNSPLSRTLFYFIRRNVVLSHMQTSQPVDPAFTDVEETESLADNVEDLLISSTIKIPDLQYQANNQLIRPCCERSKVGVIKLIETLEALDGELSHWASKVPLAWAYSIATNINPLSPSTYVPGHVHRYGNSYIGRVWNLYRVSRLVVQSILLRADSWLATSTTSLKGDNRAKLERSTRELVNDICSSVPFLSGNNISQIKRPPRTNSGEERAIWPSGNSNRIGDDPARKGRFSLIWPLYVGCGSSSVPDIQRKWMRAQLWQIAEDGEPLAEFACVEESKTLSGGQERFQFDCV